MANLRYVKSIDDFHCLRVNCWHLFDESSSCRHFDNYLVKNPPKCKTINSRCCDVAEV